MLIIMIVAIIELYVSQFNKQPVWRDGSLPNESGLGWEGCTDIRDKKTLRTMATYMFNL